MTALPTSGNESVLGTAYLVPATPVPNVYLGEHPSLVQATSAIGIFRFLDNGSFVMGKGNFAGKIQGSLHVFEALTKWAFSSDSFKCNVIDHMTGANVCCEEGKCQKQEEGEARAAHAVVERRDLRVESHERVSAGWCIPASLPLVDEHGQLLWDICTSCGQPVAVGLKGHLGDLRSGVPDLENPRDSQSTVLNKCSLPEDVSASWFFHTLKTQYTSRLLWLRQDQKPSRTVRR